MARVRIPEKTLVIVSIAVAFVVVAGLSALCYSKHRKIEGINKETSELRKQVQELQKKINLLPLLEEEMDELVEQIVEYEKILPDAKEVENLMIMLSEQANKSDCSVGDFSLIETRRTMAARRSAGQAAYQKIKFECSVSSRKLGKGYFSACKFLNLLETYKRFIAVDDFDIKGGKKEGISMTMNLSAHTYVFTGTKMQPMVKKRRGVR